MKSFVESIGLIRSSGFVSSARASRGVERLALAFLVLALLRTGPLAQPSAAALVVAPTGGLSASGFARGPFAPNSQTYTLSNNGVGSLTWFASRLNGWVSFSIASGTLGPGQSTNVTVFLNALPLEFDVGSYATGVNFVDAGNGDTIGRSVSLNISLPPNGTISYATVATSNQLQLRLTGTTGSTFEVQEATVVTGPWMSVYTNNFVAGLGTYNVMLSGAKRFFRALSSGPGAVQAVISLAQIIGQDLTQVIVTGSPFGTYVVESSPNGSTWTPVATNKAPASGSFTYTSSNTNLQYRANGVGALSVPVLDHALIVGESLATGFDGAPAMTSAADWHYRFIADPTETNLVGLFEVAVETIASSAANHIRANAPGRRMLLSNIGRNGAKYSEQKKGTSLYDLGLQQFVGAPQTVACALHAYRPQAIFAVGGEGDRINPNYDLDVRQWQSDYEADIQRVTGYGNAIPMFHSQFSAWTSFTGGSLSACESPYKVLAESEANPGRTILVCPRYVFPYVGAGASFPGFHLSNVGYRWLGEYYAKAYKKVVVDGGAWTPLKPNTITRVGAVITATFAVPAPPLVLDTTLVSNPGNFGFEYTDDSGSPPTISSVTIVGPATVEITLSSTPTGGNKRLRYAYTGVPGNSGGPTSGPRGNLRDSDSTASLYGNTLYNWCVHFDKAVN
jgi:hypothetical protein